MANSDADDVDALESELSKRDRLVNAWIAAGEDASIETVAELSGASESYASRIGQQMEKGEIGDDERSEAEVPELVEKYRQQLEAEELGARETDTQGAEAGAAGGGQAGGGRTGGEQTRDEQARDERAPGGQPPTGRPAAGGERAGGQPPGQPPQQSPGQPPRESATAAAQGGGQQPGSESGRQQRQPPRQFAQGAGQGAQGRQPPTAQAPGATPSQEEQRYVPVSQLRQVDEALALYEEEAQYEVQHSDPEGQQNQLALSKLYVAQKARTLLGAAAQNAVSRDEL